MGSLFQISNSYNIHRIRMGEWHAAVVTQQGNNEREGAVAALQEFSRSLANQNMLEGAGKEYNAAQSELAEALEGRTLAKANVAMQAAEVQGALAAQAGFVGVGGSSVELLNDTTRMQKEMQVSMMDEETARFAYRGAQRNSGVIEKAMANLDNSQYFATIDHTIFVPPRPLKNRIGAYIGIAAATWFGGPQAGQAAADATMASWESSNGQFGKAAQYYDSAARNAMAGFQTWQNARAAGKNSWGAAVFSSSEAPKQTPADGANAGADGQSLSWFQKSQTGGGGGSSWGWGFG